MSTLIAQLERMVRAHPEKPALIGDTQRVSYAELGARVEQLANELRDAGLAPGACVAIEGVNDLEYVGAYLAVVRAGGCVVPIDARLSSAEIDAILDECQPSLCLPLRADGEFGRVLSQRSSETAESFQARMKGAGSGVAERCVVLPLRGAGRSPTLPGDCVVHYSSGSTGAPKGIVLSVENICHKVQNWNATLETTDNDVFLCTLTLSHCFGMYVHTLAGLLAGATVYLPSLETITPRRIANMLAQHRVTIFGSLPYMFQAFLGMPAERLQLDTVRYLISGSAPLSAASARAFADKFGRPINQVYGLTEIGLVSFDKTGDDALSIGKLTHNMVGKIVNAAGVECGPDEPGELVVRCESMARGYLNSPEDQQAMFRDGWLWTKDIATRSADGRIYLRGRTSQFINVGGNKVAPSEVENVLLTHPAVSEAAVLGRRTNDGAEEVVAFVVPNRERQLNAVDDLFRFCSERLAAYKLPTEILLRDALPKSPLGKILKPQLLT